MRHGAKAIVCDPSFIALPALSACAAAIGNSRRIVIKRGWTEPSIIWTGLVASSSEKKTPAISLATNVLESRQISERDAAAEANKDYETELAMYENQYKAWRKNPEGTPPIKPVKQVARRYTIKDFTLESLGPILAHSPNLLINRDELDAWIGSFDKYRKGQGSDSANWLTAFNGLSITIDRKTADEPLFIRNPAVSICGGIQPAILRDAFGGKLMDSGLCARFLFAAPPKVKSRWSDHEVPDVVMQDYEDCVKRLCDLEASLDGKPVMVGMTIEAKKLFIRYVDENGEEKDASPDNVAAALGKLEGITARLALIFQMVTGPESPVSETNMRNAIRLIGWFERQVDRIMGVIDEDRADQRLRRLAEWIEQKGGEMSSSDFQRSRRDIKDSETAKTVLRELADAGFGTFEFDQPRRGRPRHVFRLHPASTYMKVDKPADLGTYIYVDKQSDGETDRCRKDDDWGKL